MGESGEKSWWEENVEDPHWQQRDAERAAIGDNPIGQVGHDISVGIEKGVYYGAKDMAVGLFAVAKWAVLIAAHDPATEKATNEAIIKGAKGAWKFAKDAYKADYGTPEERREVRERWAKSVKDLGGAISDKVKKDWDQASKEGKRAELVSHWTSRGAFEIAALFVGAGEASAVAKTGEVAADLGKLEKIGAIAKECPLAAKAAEEAAEAAKVAKALEEAKVIEKAADAPKVAAEKLIAGSPEHKAARWKDYQARGGKWKYDRWSKQYETNMQNVTRGLAREQAYRQAMGGESLTVETPLTNRQIDIFRADDNYMGQLKTGKEALSAENILAIKKDATLVEQGYKVEYILEKGASEPFLKALNEAGISYKIGPQIP